LLLISDGEDHDLKIKEAVNAAKGGFKDYFCAIETQEGSPVPIRDGGRYDKGLFKRQECSIVVSKVNSVLLKNVAKETGGKYFDAADKDISSIVAETICRLDKNKIKTGERNSKIDRFQIFLLDVLIALFAEFFCFR
jgi:Ca-activated chloride channel family protein